MHGRQMLTTELYFWPVRVLAFPVRGSRISFENIIYKYNYSYLHFHLYDVEESFLLKWRAQCVPSTSACCSTLQCGCQLWGIASAVVTFETLSLVSVLTLQGSAAGAD